MQTTTHVGFAGEVYSPDEVAREIFGFGVFEVSAQDLDFVIVPLQYLMDVGFAYSDFAGGGKAAVADVGDAAASGLRHEGFETDDFGFEPFRFLLGMAVAVSVIRLREFAAVARMQWGWQPKQNALD